MTGTITAIDMRDRTGFITCPTLTERVPFNGHELCIPVTEALGTVVNFDMAQMDNGSHRARRVRPVTNGKRKAVAGTPSTGGA
jgi:hypothetical protein